MQDEPRDQFKYQLDPERNTVTLSTPEVALDAAELDRLIHSLGVIRANMQPAQPQEPPPLDESLYHPLDGWRFMGRTGTIRTPAEDGFLLLVRSPGIGWCQAEVQPEQARGMQAFLTTRRTFG